MALKATKKSTHEI